MIGGRVANLSCVECVNKHVNTRFRATAELYLINAIEHDEYVENGSYIFFVCTRAVYGNIRVDEVARRYTRR